MGEATQHGSIERQRLERDLFSDEGWWLGLVDVFVDDHTATLRVQFGGRVPGQQRPSAWLSTADARRLAGILLALAIEAEDFSE